MASLRRPFIITSYEFDEANRYVIRHCSDGRTRQKPMSNTVEPDYTALIPLRNDGVEWPPRIKFINSP